MSGIEERLSRAEEAAAEGKFGPAFGAIDDVVAGCDDPEQLRRMRAIAEQGLEQSGRFGKRGWNRLLEKIESKQASAKPQAAQESAAAVPSELARASQ